MNNKSFWTFKRSFERTMIVRSCKWRQLSAIDSHANNRCSSRYSHKWYKFILFTTIVLLLLCLSTANTVATTFIDPISFVIFEIFRNKWKSTTGKRQYEWTIYEIVEWNSSPYSIYIFCSIMNSRLLNMMNWITKNNSRNLQVPIYDLFFYRL